MKSIIIAFGAVLILSFGVPGLVHAEDISITLEAGSFESSQDADGFHRLSMDGYKTMGGPGNPVLPVKMFNILVPPDIVWDSLELTIVESESEIVPGTYQIRPAAPDAAYVDGKMIYDWGLSVNVVDGKNMGIYGSDSFFPSEYVKLLPYSQLRKWKYARVSFSPLQYSPVPGKLKVFRKIKIKISFQRSDDGASSDLLNDKVMDHLAPGLFYNYTSGKDWYAPPEDPDQPGVTYNYVIITTEAVVSGSSKLAGFINHKQTRGYSVLVVTETDFDTLTGDPPNHRAEKIRQWLINNYSTYGIEYVLLIGDPTPQETAGVDEDIPMKMCWPLGNSAGDDSPTDAFYADLTGDWDLDGDEYYGEWSDFNSPGGVDFAMEVWVGRIPVYSADYSTLDSVLQKIIDYERETATSWRESILLPMSFSTSSYDGAPLAEQIKDDYLDARAYVSWRQYQQGSGACFLDSDYTSEEELRGGTMVRDRWAANGYGIVCWWGHGSATSALVGCDGCWDGTLFNNTQTSSLNDDYPSFTYQCSCTNAYPENTNNLAYSILKRGGIATVSATRVSWFNTGVGYGDFDGSSTNSGIGYEYVERLTRNQTGARSLYGAKLAVTPDIGVRDTRLMNQYDFNLYGDPTVRISSAVGDELAVDFGTYGLWHYDGSDWTNLAGWNPYDMVEWGSGLAVDFDGYGVWNYDGTTWSRLSGWNPSFIEAYGSGLSVDFDTYGLWFYDGSGWTILAGWDPVDMIAWDNGLAVDFGTYGLWNYDGTTWTSLAGWNPEGIVKWGTGLAVDFGSYGLWQYSGFSWTNLAGWNPVDVEEWTGGLAVNFATWGLWNYDGSAWSSLTGWIPENTAAYATCLAVDFGPNGLWSYDGASWTNIAGWNPGSMKEWAGGLGVDFDTYGLWHYNGSSWTNLAGWDAEDMVDVNLY